MLKGHPHPRRIIESKPKRFKKMMKYIDSKQLVTIIVAAVVVFFLNKYLTKKVTNKDGSVSHYAGHDAIGHI